MEERHIIENEDLELPLTDSELEDDFKEFDGLDDDSADEPLDEDDDSEFRESRHAELKKKDKIFNNSYNTGDGIQHDGYHSQEIKLSPAYSDSYLQESDGYTERLGLGVVQTELEEVYKKNPKLFEIIGSKKRKYSKTDVNYVFQVLFKELNSSIFANSIHVLDAVCNLLQIEYKKAFDMLDYEFKEILVSDLDESFGVLSSNFKTRSPKKIEEDDDDEFEDEDQWDQ